MYCLKCRRVTETENIANTMSKKTNEAWECVISGKTKCQFVKKRNCWWKLS